MTVTINLVGPSTSPGAPQITPAAVNTAVNTALAEVLALVGTGGGGAGSGTSDFSIGVTQPGVASSGERLVVYRLPVVIALPTGLVGSAAVALTAATSSAVFTLAYKRSGTTTTIATFTFAPAGTVATIAVSAIPTLLAGDVLLLTAPSPADATLADIGVTIAATRAVAASTGTVDLGSPGPIGSTTPSTGAFTSLSASGTVSGAGFIAWSAAPGPVGSVTPSTGAFTTLTATSFNASAIGNTTPSTGAFTTLTVSGTLSGAGFITRLASPGPIGSTTPDTGAFSTLTSSGTVSGAGFTLLFASPGAIGNTTPASGAFTTLSSSGTATLADLAVSASKTVAQALVAPLAGGVPTWRRLTAADITGLSSTSTPQALTYSRAGEDASTAAIRAALVALGLVTDSTTPGQAYYVSTTGSDAANGSFTTPFLTLGAARTAMRATTIKTALFKAGTFASVGTINFDAGDNNLTFAAAPGATVVLSAAAFTLTSCVGMTFSGLTITNPPAGNAVTLANSSNNTFSRCAINNVTNPGGGNGSAFEVKDNSNSNVFDRNTITGVAAVNTQGGGFFLHGAWSNIISRNLVQDCVGMGIGVNDWNSPIRSVDNFNNQIIYNIVRNTCTNSNDVGAIYTLGRNGLDTGLIIRGNLVDMVTHDLTQMTVGIYLDDMVSGVSVTGNIIRGPHRHSFHLHGGRNNTITNNIVDMSAAQNSGLIFLDAPATDKAASGVTWNIENTSITGNIFYRSNTVATFTQANYLPLESHNEAFSGPASNDPHATTNIYWCPSFAGSVPLDTNPKLIDPLFTNATTGNYALTATTSAVQVAFTQIDQTLYGPSAP